MGTQLTNPTFYLFATPSIVEGLARLIDLGGTMQIYNESETENEADQRAIYLDWLAVGNDLRSAYQSYERKSVKA